MYSNNPATGKSKYILYAIKVLSEINNLMLSLFKLNELEEILDFILFLYTYLSNKHKLRFIIKG